MYILFWYVFFILSNNSGITVFLGCSIISTLGSLELSTTGCSSIEVEATGSSKTTGCSCIEVEATGCSSKTTGCSCIEVEATGDSGITFSIAVSVFNGTISIPSSVGVFPPPSIPPDPAEPSEGSSSQSSHISKNSSASFSNAILSCSVTSTGETSGLSDTSLSKPTSGLAVNAEFFM